MSHISLNGHLGAVGKPGGDRRFYLIISDETIINCICRYSGELGK